MRILQFLQVLMMFLFVWHHIGSFLTVIFKVWLVLMVIVIAMIDEGMWLLEVIRRLLADSVCVMREGSDSSILFVIFTLKYKFHYVCLSHNLY